MYDNIAEIVKCNIVFYVNICIFHIDISLAQVSKIKI